MVNRTITLCIALAALPLWSRGQQLEFGTPEKLPAPVNSAGEECLPLLSPGGEELYFARALFAGNVGGKFSGLDAWFSEAAGERWQGASNELPARINNQEHNAVVGMSRDGNTIYFMSAGTDEKMSGIYATSKIGDYWGRPRFVPVPGIDNQNFVGVYVSPDFDVMLFSMKASDTRGEEDLYFSVKDASGQWTVPRNMGATINTRGFEISPFLSSDKKRLYFASSGHEGQGDADIFYSDRLYNSWETWSLPVNLGAEVNSKKFDAYFSIYGDSTAYFSSNRDGRFADIYRVDVRPVRSILKEGQRYLSGADWNREVGAAVSNALVFAAGSSRLTPAQEELLFFIANKLQLRRGILFHLVVTEAEDPGLSEERLKAVAAQLIQSGISEERVLIEQAEPARKAKQGKIELRLVE